MFQCYLLLHEGGLEGDAVVSVLLVEDDGCRDWSVKWEPGGTLAWVQVWVGQGSAEFETSDFLESSASALVDAEAVF